MDATVEEYTWEVSRDVKPSDAVRNVGQTLVAFRRCSGRFERAAVTEPIFSCQTRWECTFVHVVLHISCQTVPFRHPTYDVFSTAFERGTVGTLTTEHALLLSHNVGQAVVVCVFLKRNGLETMLRLPLRVSAREDV